jgi:Ni/Co efflux regulator RcnB
MGQNETTVATASSSTLRRIVLALLVAALMAVTMLAASASAAKADVDRGGATSGKPLRSGDFDQALGSVVHHNPDGSCVAHFGHNFNKPYTGGGC